MDELGGALVCRRERLVVELGAIDFVAQALDGVGELFTSGDRDVAFDGGPVAAEDPIGLFDELDGGLELPAELARDIGAGRAAELGRER